MNIKFWAKVGIIMGSILVGAFVLLLLSPLILNFAIDKYTPQIVGESSKILSKPKSESRFDVKKNPYGDGHSAEKVEKIINAYCNCSKIYCRT